VLGAYVGAKLRQHERWGSDKWIEKYSCRTFIEGFFGTFQSRDGEGARRGWIRVVGITAIAVMTALAMVHDNLRIVRKWAQKNNFQSAAYPRSAPPGPARPSDGPTRPITRHPGPPAGRPSPLERRNPPPEALPGSPRGVLSLQGPELCQFPVAVAVGFEPTVDFHPHTLSRRAP
jgi:hypothetical protein